MYQLEPYSKSKCISSMFMFDMNMGLSLIMWSLFCNLWGWGVVMEGGLEEPTPAS